MASDFNYDSPEVDPIAVADAIRCHYRLPELSQEEREQRRIENELYRWECQQRGEQRAFEYQQQQAAEAEAARREAAIAAEQARQKAQREMRERDRERDREQQLVGLHIRAKQQEVWQSNVDAAARRAVAVRQQQALLADVERHLIPPPPEPEPEVIYVEAEQGTGRLGHADFDPRLMARPLRWFG